jgi:predicted PurR-regulated permease PerM
MNQQQRILSGDERRKGGRSETSIGSVAETAASQVEVTDPHPPESKKENWQAASRAATVVLGFVAFIAALYLARSIIMPVLAALIIGITLHPIQKRAAEYGIPKVLTAAVLVVAFFTLLYLVATLLIGALTAWLAQNPDLGAVVKEKFRWVEGPLSTIKELTKSLGDAGGAASPTVAVETGLAPIVRQAVAILTPAVSEFLVFFGTLLFFLVGIDKLRRQLITWFGTRSARLRVVRIWGDIEQNLITYLATVTVINLGLGVVTASMLYLVGFPNPLAFGVLTFILNYVPYVGPAIIVMTLFGVGLITAPILGGAALPPILFLAIATVEGHFLTPAIVGRRLTLSPFLVFLAVAFWTWLWGPLGTFMATPLLIVTLVVLSHLFPRAEEPALPK